MKHLLCQKWTSYGCSDSVWLQLYVCTCLYQVCKSGFFFYDYEWKTSMQYALFFMEHKLRPQWCDLEILQTNIMYYISMFIMTQARAHKIMAAMKYNSPPNRVKQIPTTM